MLSRLSIRLRATFLMVLIFILFIGMNWFAYHSTNIAEEIGIHEAASAMLDGEKEKIKIATHTIALAISTTLEEIDGEKSKIDVVQKMVDSIRFFSDRSGYYFVYRGTVNAAHPTQKQLIGKDLGNVKDKNGVFYVRELNEKAKNGGGFVDFVFDKPGKGLTPKLGYCEKIPGSDLWIGTGIYIDSIDSNKESIHGKIQKGTQRNFIIISALVGLFFFGFVLPLSIHILRSIRVPLVKARDAALKIAEGDLNITVEEFGKDEIAQLNDALNNMAMSLREMIWELSLGVETLVESSTELSDLSGSLTGDSKVSSEKSSTVSSAAVETNQRMESIARAMGEASEQINLIAAAAEEMSTTIGEIGKNSQTAHNISENAVVHGENALKKVKQLGQAANEIGKVTETIAEISEQTNLLALNATIEAARAGEFGKGFAVVANEIKELSRQTAEATSEITNRINGIQTYTHDTIVEIEDISGIIIETNDIVKSIASAIEQQASTTNEIAENVAQSSHGIQDVEENIIQTVEVTNKISKDIMAVSQTAENLSSTSSGAKIHSDKLNELAIELKTIINKFKL